MRRAQVLLVYQKSAVKSLNHLRPVQGLLRSIAGLGGSIFRLVVNMAAHAPDTSRLFNSYQEAKDQRSFASSNHIHGNKAKKH